MAYCVAHIKPRRRFDSHGNPAIIAALLGRMRSESEAVMTAHSEGMIALPAARERLIAAADAVLGACGGACQAAIPYGHAADAGGAPQSGGGKC
jgi:hypothetical protein